jgi:hypothetical protein
MHGLNVHLEDGRILHVIALAEDVLRYWQKELS